ncbi:unnamed protein product [Arctia plantaginis]|uniref:Uncharacterized protein n=1 Tax=Arctia plantaginis TaxID=874455 RepID=A0A8S0ZH42_ARCPL|nr:unnamed protein product [Arctia plantaginis]
MSVYHDEFISKKDLRRDVLRDLDGYEPHTCFQDYIRCCCSNESRLADSSVSDTLPDFSNEISDVPFERDRFMDILQPCSTSAELAPSEREPATNIYKNTKEKYGQRKVNFHCGIDWRFGTNTSVANHHSMEGN